MNYEKKVKCIEKKLHAKKPFVDPKDKIQVVVASKSEMENEVKKREMELIQRYGEEALNQITFACVINFGDSRNDKEYQ
jgi:hypothetical protein